MFFFFHNSSEFRDITPAVGRSPLWRSFSMYVSEVRSSRRPLWLWPNLLSLDAPLIAVLWLQLFAVSLHVRLEPAVSLALAVVVWLIYVGDRLADGWNANPRATLTARHRFHRVHRRSFGAAMAAALSLAVWLCLRLDAATFRAGLALSLAVGSYFAAVHVLRLRVPKEAVVALLFSVGTFFPVWIHGVEPSSAMSVLLGLFAGLCWLNVVLIEYSEWAGFGRSRSEMPHATTLFAGPRLTWIATLVAVLAGSLACFPGFRPESPVLLAIAVSAAALASLSGSRRLLSTDSIRVLADVALLTPLFVLPWLIR